MKKLLSIFFISIAFSASAQTDPIEQSSNILPPSPTASELGKYGLVPVGMSTGTPNIDLPIYTYNSKSLSIPVTISYNSNGIKVDQIASWVGMGWSLNAGGVITRTIRDMADEDNLGFPYPESMFNPDTNAEAIRYLQMAGDDDGFDSEVDLYSFNFQGHSGKFVFDRNGVPVVMPYQNIKIEKYSNSGAWYFVITTSDGVAYTFASVETTQTYSYGAGCGKNYTGSRETSWYLTKIQNPVGDVINLEYVSHNGYTYKANVSQVLMKKILATACSPGNDCPVFSDKTCVNQLQVNGKALKRIWSTNQGEIEFIASQTRTDISDYKLDTILVKNPAGQIIRRVSFEYTFSNTDVTYNNQVTSEELKHRMFLTSMTERDANNTGVRAHTFEYNDMNGMPPRLAFAQDHWGFFNGADNTYLVPKYLEVVDAVGNKLFPTVDGDREPNDLFSSKGMLTKINYPTGGNTQLQYEANTYWGTYLSYPAKTPVFKTVTGIDPYTTVTNTYVVENVTNQEIYISATAALDPGYAPEQVDPVHHFAILNVRDLTISTDLISNRRLDIGETYETYVTLTVGHEYSFQISANGNIVDAGYNFDYYATAPQSITTNIKTGGIRVKKVLNTDPATNKNEETNYIYAKVSDLAKSTGQIGSAPIYYAESTIKQPCGSIQCLTYDCVYGSLYSSSQNSIYPVGGNHIYYDHVTVSRGSGYSNGVEEHEFFVQFDSPGQVIWGENIMNASFSNLGWTNGLEKAVKVYSYKAGVFVINKETINNYVVDNRYSNSINSLVVRKKYAASCPTQAVIQCNASNREKVYYEFTCTTNHDHWWLIGGLPWGSASGEMRCIAFGANNQWVVTGYHPCYHQYEVSEVTYPAAIQHLDAIEYKNIAYWFYVNSSTEKVYDENGLNPVVTVNEFVYNNPEHAQLSTSRVTGSDNVIKEVNTWYPQDYDDTGNILALKNNNILGVPIKIEKAVGANQVEGSVFLYTDQGQPKDVYSYSSDQLIPPATHNALQLIPSASYQWKGTLTYSASKNLTDVVSENSPVTSYLWDYADSKPIAKVVNASSAQIAYTSFEADGKGNWNFTGATFNDIAVRTGKYYYKLSGGSITRILSAGSYKLEYWAKGTVSISGGTIVSSSNSVADANGWILYQKEININSTTTMVISGTTGSFVDELRLSPVGAQMVTTTYEPGIGVTSMTDANQVTNYYQYDSFGRLEIIRDDKGNIIKTFSYHYKQ